MAAHQHTPRVERLASSPAGAGRFVAGTVARMQNATALFMNVVEKEEFSEVRCSKVAVAERTLRRLGWGCALFWVHLYPPWTHSWQGIVASGHRLLRANFLRILGTLIGLTVTVRND